MTTRGPKNAPERNVVLQKSIPLEVLRIHVGHASPPARERSGSARRLLGGSESWVLVTRPEPVLPAAREIACRERGQTEKQKRFDRSGKSSFISKGSPGAGLPYPPAPVPRWRCRAVSPAGPVGRPATFARVVAGPKSCGLSRRCAAKSRQDSPHRHPTVLLKKKPMSAVENVRLLCLEDHDNRFIAHERLAHRSGAIPASIRDRQLP